jgi:hypothetical protein
VSEGTLTAGRWPSYRDRDVERVVGRHHDLGTWRSCGERLAEVSLLNLATICVFLDHVAMLEGFGDASGEAIERTTFRNLPWWESNVWLPFDFVPPSKPVNPKDPIFVGSSVHLVAELKQVQAMSTLHLGVAPDGYVVTSAQPRALLVEPRDLEGEDLTTKCTQWVWRGLYDAAEFAISQGVQLWV